MSDTIRAMLVFIVQTVFNIYLFVLMIRLVLAWVGAEHTHPVTKTIVNLTSFIIKPMKKIFRDFGKFETATVVLILIIELIKFLIISALSFGFPNLIGLFIIAIVDAIQLLLQTMTYAILIQAILSWIQPGSPMNSLLYQFTSPIMRPLQRHIPLIGGVDITPIPAIIILQLIIIAIIKPLIAFGMGIAFG